jgi:polar amino acid transport system substrate-binding protein
MKKFLSLILVLVLALSLTTLAGCSTKKADTETEDTSLQDVLDSGTLVLGLDDSFPPMGFRDENNEIVGFDIDLAEEVAERLGVTLEPTPIDWDAKEMNLESGDIDCIWNGLSYTDERNEAMALTEPYLANDMVFAVLGDSDIKTLDDLKGKKIAVQTGSYAEELLADADITKTFKKVVDYADYTTAYLDLEAGGVDAVFLDLVVANYNITKLKKDYKILEEGLEPDNYVIAFRKGNNALRDKVEEILSEMKKDGTAAKISEKWFGKDVTLIK